ncbi:MAG: VCBS repeat-containing protein [Thermosipho sp. (in: Bacteria)]|nr:VCBS repeat-containing protein [Thermosipho sp. (in: thermotogales)]
MYYYPFCFLSQENRGNIYVLDFKRGDVNGDSIIDNIYLIGQKPYGIQSPFTDNIALIIQDGSTNAFYRIVPEENAGYNPTIFLGDFTGDRVNEVLISIDSGGSGGYAFYYIYSFMNNTPVEIFNHEKYNQKYTYRVTYKDCYQVEVKGNTKKYTIDIKYKGREYLSEIYDENGRLKAPIEGWVNPLGGLYPVDFQRDGTYGLYASRQIAGRYNADALGYVQTSLEWNGSDFVPFFQTVGVLG